MHLSRMLWATTLMLRGFPHVSAFLIKSHTVPRVCSPFLLTVSAQQSRSLRSTPTSGTQHQAKKKGPKLNKKRNKHLLRADRVLANRGWGSRSECTELLKRRRVFCETPDGTRVVVKGPSEKVTMDTPLFVDSTPVPVVPLLLVYHKPKWVLSVLHDPHGRPNIGSLLSDVQRRQKLHPVGRLDYDTSGLLLFSTNGSLTQRYYIQHMK